MTYFRAAGLIIGDYPFNEDPRNVCYTLKLENQNMNFRF